MLHCSGLHFAAAVGNPRCARLLLKAGADVDVPDKEGDACPRPSHLHLLGQLVGSSSFAGSCKATSVPGGEEAPEDVAVRR